MAFVNEITAGSETRTIQDVNAQTKDLATPITIDGVQQTTVEGALGALNTQGGDALQKSGGTMSGNIAMGGNKVTGLTNGVNDADAVTVQQLNEQISSNTAFYRGSFATKAALLAVAWQTSDPSAANYVTNNDFAYVESDETHDGEAWRYAYVYEAGGSGNGWTAQYRINEAPLTSAQIAALNSGATASNIAQIGTNSTAISNIKNGTNIDSFGAVETALAGKQGELTFDTTPTAGSTNPVTSGGIKTALDGKAGTATATTTASGLMSATDKAKLNGIADNATANSPYTDTPAMDGTGSTGSNANYARGDHVHPTDTSRLAVIGKGVNLLEDWYFMNPVNQRGVTVVSNPGYFIDRWRLVSGTVNVTASGLTLTSGTVIEQRLEFAPPAQRTASVLTSSGSASAAYSTYTDGGSTVYAFRITASSAATVVAAKLEQGAVQTLYSGTTLLDPPPNYQQELAKCQRFFQRVSLGCDFLADVFGQIIVSPTLPVQLRSAPSSVTVSSPSGATGSVQVYNNGYVDLPISDLRSSSPNFVSFRVPGTSANQAFLVNGFVDINAEL